MSSGSVAPPVLLLSCGGYRSGSTYLYNLLGEYVERSNVGRRIGYVEPDQAPLLEQLWSVVEALGAPVAKSHDAPGVTPGAEAWAAPVAAGRVLPLCTVRDWREVLASFCHKFRQGPEQVLASRRWDVNLRNLAWWRGHGALEVRYERLAAAPQEVLATVTAVAGLAHDEQAGAAAVTAASRGAAAAVAAGLPDDGVHARTLLHADHLGRPASDTWEDWTRDWDADRWTRVRTALEPLLVRDGYAWERAPSRALASTSSSLG